MKRKNNKLLWLILVITCFSTVFIAFTTYKIHNANKPIQTDYDQNKKLVSK